MRKIVIFFVLFLFPVLYADFVPRQTAEQVARNLMMDRFEEKLDVSGISEVNTDTGIKLFYVFELSPQGFILISADNAAYPVPAYSWESNFDYDIMPIQFISMFDSYKEEVERAISDKLDPVEFIRAEWQYYSSSEADIVPRNIRVVSPLLSTIWDQGATWNNSCPPDATGPGGYCYAGCTATATAQVMKYHAHPGTGEGTHSYNWPPYGTLSANFGATSYNWASMPNASASAATQQLLYHVGVGAEMQYGPTSSGAWIGGNHPATALSTLQENFRYNPNAYYDLKNNYNNTVWDGMLKSELDNSRPLVYAGYGDNGGHTFVLDGYQGASNNHYHVNWGWNGSYNGYFYLNSLVPYPGYDYTSDQEALFQVEPRKWKPLPDLSIDVSQLTYVWVDLDYYCEVSSTGYSVVTDLSSEEFTLTINGNNVLIFTANPTVTSNVDLDITIRTSYSSGIADDTFNFKITGVTSDYDYGDAPDPNYPTLLASTGARHGLDGITWLGAGVDSEQDGQPTLNSMGDDNDVTGDDEDGVSFDSALIPGSTANVTVSASTGGLLCGWIDFNRNGSWADSGEQIFADQVLLSGANSLSFSVPASSILGSTYARFRFSGSQGIQFYGDASIGEVEDYQVEIGDQNTLLKWEQLPDLTTLGFDVYCASLPGAFTPVVLADDFLCSATGPVTHIEVWGSWYNDIQPQDFTYVTFSFNIHADIPDPDGDGPEYSKPGPSLWSREFAGEEINAELFFVGEEGWYHPGMNNYIPNADTQCWLYSFDIDPQDAFEQLGTVDDPVVYWLSLQLYYEEPGAFFGWKTSETHWNDDATWYEGMDLWAAAWNELIYPLEHPWAGESVDLAFSIKTELDQLDEFDFGDAPDPTYPTLLASDGARHLMDSNIYLGASVDSEGDGISSVNADGDDILSNDDEDGISLVNLLTPGWNGVIDVTASVDGFLNAWADFNNDGDWLDTGEQIFTNTLINSGTIQTNFAIPSDAVGGNTYFRFRFTTYSVASPSYLGLETDGEVEDYRFYIETLDFGDAPDPAFPTLLASNGARHIADENFCLGQIVDLEPDGNPGVNADGDDTVDLDDEDGIIFATSLVPGQQAIIDIYNTSLSGINGYLDGWIDFNGDGDWDDAYEQIFNDFALSGWPVNFNSVFVNIPNGAVVNSNVHCRFRMSTTGGLSYDGLGGIGEVEDYVVYIIEPFGENKIHHPQWPDASVNGVDVFAEDPVILADDFQCSESGAITEIHFWGSWMNDENEEGLLAFEISFWSDVPDPDAEGLLYSMPDEALWTSVVDASSYTENLHSTVLDGEWWYNSMENYALPNADTEIWHYKIIIPEDEAFIQYQGNIYWISIRVIDPTNPDLTYNFGWKSCDPPQNWNDDAVWCSGDMNWEELTYPSAHPLYPEPIGLSFYLSGVDLPEAPLNPETIIGNDYIRLEWSAGAPGDSYKIYSSNDPYAPFPSDWVVEAITANNYWQDGPPMPAGDNKFYRVARE